MSVVVTQPVDLYSRAAETQVGDEASLEGNSANGAAVIERQPTLSRVSPEEAASLPYDELRRRMEAEARLAEEGLLPDARGGEQAEASEPDADAETGDAGETSGASGAEEAIDGQPKQGRSGTSQQVGNQSPDRVAQLEAEIAKVQRERQEEQQAQQRQRLADQHRNAEAAIAQLPRDQQEIARLRYQNSLHQTQLNDYTTYLQQREQAIAQQEFTHAKQFFSNSMDSLAQYVAERFDVKPEIVASFGKSKEAKALLEAATTPQSLQTAAASIGQTMEWLAAQEQQRLRSQREQRRESQSNRVQRDMPNAAGNVTSGGGMDEVARINNMSRTEFFAWKAEQLRRQQESA